MVVPGKTSRLKVVEKTYDGFYVDAAEFDALLLPAREVPEGTQEGDELDVFLYRDSSDNMIATTKKPTVEVGECAYIEVLTVNEHGAFLDWGLPKDLFMPHSEQAYPMKEGSSYVVYAYLDERSGRVACSTKLHHHLAEANVYLKPGDAVNLLIYGQSKLGFKAVINGSCIGLIYHESLGQPLQFGDQMKGWIKEIREDGKIDLSVNALDDEARDELETRVLSRLRDSGGRLDLSDKSSPEDIFRAFKVSKKNFKRAISSLYKQRLIRIEPNHIELI